MSRNSPYFNLLPCAPHVATSVVTNPRITPSDWSLPGHPSSNAEVELGEKFTLPAVNEIAVGPVVTLLAALRHGEYSLAGMSLSYEGKVVLVTGAGGGKISMQKNKRELARVLLLVCYCC